MSKQRTHNAGLPGAEPKSKSNRYLIYIRLSALLVFMLCTNFGLAHRVSVLYGEGRPIAIVGFAAVWTACFAALAIIALHPNVFARAGWGFVFAVATAFGLGFRYLSSSDLSVLDLISLWSARDEVGRATEFFGHDVWWLVLVAIIGWAIIASPPVPARPVTVRWLKRLSWAPLLPIVSIAAIIFMRQGGGAAALPTQFAPLSIAAASGVALAMNPRPPSRPVAWQPGPHRIQKVVLIVDESVRGDYIDWSPGNPYTPELAGLKSRLIDFGPAASGGVCSSYSNVILRYGAAHSDLGKQFIANPPIWDYARKAGFRSVFIDAQAGFFRDGALVNFMTMEEVGKVGHFYAIRGDVPTYDLDYKLLDIMAEELKKDGPVFIYAVKNGAHFPYDPNYPDSAKIFGPTLREAGEDGQLPRINSYRNAIGWSVDKFFKSLFQKVNLDDTLIVYTSDHAEQFDPGKLPHCATEPDPRTEVVPLLAVTGDVNLRAELEHSAETSRFHATHFAIFPTILEMMGYNHEDVSSKYKFSLLKTISDDPISTSGDIFGLFSSKVDTHPVDLRQRYDEPSPTPLRLEGLRRVTGVGYQSQ